MQVISYSVVFDKAPVDQLPLLATGPLQPPEAVHCVTLLAFHDRVELPRLLTVVGEAVRVTVGAEVTLIFWDCETCPPVPVQVSV